MDKVKIALVGCGQIARSAHLPGYMAERENSEIKYFVDIIPERAKFLANTYGSGICLTDYKDILEDHEISGVSVCTPNYTHAPITIDFLNSGKHVLCEKPASVNKELVYDMKKAADANGKTLNIGVCNRFNTAVNNIKKLIESGELGEVYHIYCSFRSHRSIPGLGSPFTTKALSGGGVLIDWGVHFLDLIFYCLEGVIPKTVSAATYSKLARNMKEYAYKDMWAGPPDYSGTYDVEECVSGFIRTDGANISFNGAWAQNIGENAMFIEFLGTKGGVKLEYMGNYTIYSSKDGILYKTIPEYSSEGMYINEIKDFISAIKNNAKSRNNIDNVLITAKVMDAIYQSSDLGKEVELG